MSRIFLSHSSANNREAGKAGAGEIRHLDSAPADYQLQITLGPRENALKETVNPLVVPANVNAIARRHRCRI